MNEEEGVQEERTGLCYFCLVGFLVAVLLVMRGLGGNAPVRW